MFFGGMCNGPEMINFMAGNRTKKQTLCQTWNGPNKIPKRDSKYRYFVDSDLCQNRVGCKISHFRS